MNLIVRFINRIIFKKQVKDDEGENVVDSIVRCRNLYRELCCVAHPDLHSHKREIAENIMARVNENRHNYSALKDLKREVEVRLLESSKDDKCE